MPAPARQTTSPLAVDGALVSFDSGGTINIGDVVVVSGAWQVSQSAGASKAAIGVALSATTAANQKVLVATKGIVYVKAAGAINAGDIVSSAASGQVAAIADSATTPTGTDVDASRQVLGIALTAATNAGDYLYVYLVR